MKREDGGRLKGEGVRARKAIDLRRSHRMVLFPDALNFSQIAHEWDSAGEAGGGRRPDRTTNGYFR